MQLPKNLDMDVSWWETNIPISSNPIRLYTFSLVIFSDASRTGWGAACNGEVVHGGWSIEEQNFHINYLKLVAVLFALQCFADKEFNCEILLRVDNTTAVAYINRMGGIQFPHLNSMAKKIWQFC